MAENINISFAPNKNADEAQRIADIENYLQTLTERTKFALSTIIENYNETDDKKTSQLKQNIALQSVSDSVGKFTNSDKNCEIFNDYANNVAQAHYSHAEGYKTSATAPYTHSEGSETVASAPYAHAEGYDCKATSDSAHAEGKNTQATGYASHAEGVATVTSGDCSHAEGFMTIAQGLYSHAEGGRCKALGSNSHAGGYYSEASGPYSFVHGYGVKTSNYNCGVAFGRRNKTQDALFVIGNGSWQEGSERDALTLTETGMLWIEGSFEASAQHGGLGISVHGAARFGDNWTSDSVYTLLAVGNGTDANHLQDALTLDRLGNLHISGKLTADGGIDIPIATAESVGGIKIGENLTISEDGTLSANSGGYTLPIATADTLGGVKIGDNIAVTDDGTISVDLSSYLQSADISDWAKQPTKPEYTASEVGAAAEIHSHTVSDITDMPDWAKQPEKPVYTADEVGAAAEQHKHSTADITDFPAIPTKVSELQNDSGYLSTETDPTVPAWAKADTKPTYTASEVGAAEAVHTHAQSDITGLASALASKANTSHTHKKSDITDMPTSLKNPNALTVQFNGTTNQTYDGSVAKTVNITPAGIGAAMAEDITTAIDAVNIGARNIATGTASMTVGAINSALWSNGQWRYSGTGSIATIDIADSPVPSISKGIRVTSSAANKQIGIVQDKIPLNSYNIYTLSCWVRGSAASGLKCKLQPFYASSTDNGGVSEINITDQWQYVSFTTVRSPQNTAEYSAAYIYLISSAIGDTMDICGVKLERGNKATDWCPAPEDKADKDHTHSDYLPLTGGTITGNVDFNAGDTAWNLKCVNTGFEKGTIPTDYTKYWALNFMDKNGGKVHENRVGYLSSYVAKTTGTTITEIVAMKNEKNSSESARIAIGKRTNGTEYLQLGSSTIGDSETPVYINAGQVTPTDYKFSDFMLASGKGAISEEHSFWSGTSSHTFNYVTGRNRAFIIAWMDDTKSTYMGFNLIYAATTVNTTSAVRLAYNGTVSMSYNIANGNITIGTIGNGASGYACRCAVIWFTV